jgi:AcrR family transcriptional regulator
VPKAASKASRQRRQRGSINAEEIIDGAFEVARRESLDQLSMPALAEHLGVGVTSIYWYFRKKDDLLNAMTDVALDAVLRGLPPITGDQPWQEMLSSHCHASRELHRDDQILTDLLLLRTSTYTKETTRRAFEMEEVILRRLVDAGFTPSNAFMVYNTASVFMRGMIIVDRTLRLSDAPTLDDRQERLADWSTMPLLGSLVDRHLFAGTTDEDFTFGMRRLISGFEALLADQDAKGAGRVTAQPAVKGTRSTAKSRAVPASRAVPPSRTVDDGTRTAGG